MLLVELEPRHLGGDSEALLSQCYVGVIDEFCFSLTDMLEGFGVTVMLEGFEVTFTFFRFFPAIIAGGAALAGRKLWILGLKTSFYETALPLLTWGICIELPCPCPVPVLPLA